MAKDYNSYTFRNKDVDNIQSRTNTANDPDDKPSRSAKLKARGQKNIDKGKKAKGESQKARATKIDKKKMAKQDWKERGKKMVAESRKEMPTNRREEKYKEKKYKEKYKEKKDKEKSLNKTEKKYWKNLRKKSKRRSGTPMGGPRPHSPKESEAIREAIKKSSRGGRN